MNRIIKILAAAVLLLTVFTFAVHAEPTVAFGDNSTNCMLYGQTYELYLTETDPSVPVYFKGKPSSRIQIKNDNQVVILAPGSCTITAHNAAQDGKRLATRQFIIRKRAESLTVNFTETILYPGESVTLEVTPIPADATDFIDIEETVSPELNPSDPIVRINRETSSSAILEAKKAGTEIVKIIARYDVETSYNDPGNVYAYVTVHVHEHDWSDEWVIDGDYHYHECMAEHCKITDNSEKKSYDIHMYNEAGFCVCGKPREVLDGDGDGYYEIRNAGDLVSFANKVNAGETEINGTLLNSVDLSGYPLVPIGTAAHPFAGNFDGQIFAITGIDCEATSDNFGVFGVVDGGTVKSLKLEGEIRLSGDYAYIGSAVGRAKGGAVIEKIISNVNLTGEGKSRHIGGITGSSEKLGGTLAVTKCLYGGHIDLPNVDDAVGGIIGYANDNVTLSYCGFTGSVTANTKTGGILGYVNNKSFGGLTNCYGAGQASGVLAGFLRNCGENLRHNAYDASQNAFGGGYEASITLGLANASSVSDWTTGQAAFLLNRKTVIKTSGDKVTETVEEHTDDGVWRQTLGTDAYPNFSGKVVYRTGTTSYSNTKRPVYVVYGEKQRAMTATVYAEKSYYMAVVRYKDGRITSVRVDFCQHSYGHPVEWDLPYSDSDRIKVMLFDFNSLEDLRPLCEYVEYVKRA